MPINHVSNETLNKFIQRVSFVCVQNHAFGRTEWNEDSSACFGQFKIVNVTNYGLLNTKQNVFHWRHIFMENTDISKAIITSYRGNRHDIHAARIEQVVQGGQRRDAVRLVFFPVFSLTGSWAVECSSTPGTSLRFATFMASKTELVVKVKINPLHLDRWARGRKHKPQVKREESGNEEWLEPWTCTLPLDSTLCLFIYFCF